MATIPQIIGKINPELYAKNSKALLKEYGSREKIPADKIEPNPLVTHSLEYDSSVETLEPLYFFILDMMNDSGLATEKLVDNFSSSPGSGHFAELGQRATIMQNQASKVLGDINIVLRSVLNIIYDLKEFRIRLQSYDDLKSPNKEGAMLALKQIWMDKVDIQKQNSSIKAMALGQSGYTTLIDAFLAVKDEKDVHKLDLNDRVKRIILPRIHEFNTWVKQSEQELRKRYELEKTYLKSQVNSLKLYSRWAKPYLRTAYELESKIGDREPALVKTFNTIILELGLLGKRKINVKDLSLEGVLPREFSSEKFLKSLKRDYYICILVEFKFRGIPQRVSQQAHFTFGGKADIHFKAYALNSDELKKINKELEESDVGDVLKLIKGITDDSLEQIQNEINFFLEEKDTKSESEKKNTGSNPFLALFGFYEKSPASKEKTDKPKKEMPLVKDNWIEKTHLRSLAMESAKDTAWTLFDVYKKSHGMASYT